MSKLEEYISTLSKKEQKKYKEFIDEAREREKQLDKSFKSIKENLGKFSNTMNNLYTGLETLDTEIKKVNETLEQTKNTILLKSFSDDEFYKA